MATNFEQEDRTTRDDLVARVALMEAMVAEGRKTTARYGGVFVMWGIIYFAAMSWVYFLPFKNWAWPTLVSFGILVSIVYGRRQRASLGSVSVRSRSIEAVWQTMCAAIILYVVAAGVSGHCDQPAFFAAILFLVGLAHGVSARILRWGAQGLVAAIWWGCGAAMFFFRTRNDTVAIFLLASFWGMILFGLYAMWLERRRAALELHHA